MERRSRAIVRAVTEFTSHSFIFILSICYHVRFTFLSRACHASQLHFVWLLYVEITRPAVNSQ